MKIQAFTDLGAWKEGHIFVLRVYKACDTLPKKELYGLNSQICRAAVSVTSNIAEGFARRTYKDKRRFYYMALGSLMEVQNQLIIARDVGYFDDKLFSDLASQALKTKKILRGLISSTENRTS